LNDTAYIIREKYLENNYKGKLIEYRNTRTYKNGPFRELICAEFYLSGYDHIFACHFGRGSTLGKAKYLKEGFFYRLPIIGNLLLLSKGKKEKKSWIKICKNIVDEYKID